MGPIEIKMDDLIFAWQDNAPDNAYYLDLETGDVRIVQRGLLDLDDLTDEIETDRERFLFVPRESPGQLKKDLARFIETVNDPDLQRLLPVALEASDAAGALQGILSRSSDELSRWHAFRRQQAADQIERWLDANAVTASRANLDFAPPE